MRRKTRSHLRSASHKGPGDLAAFRAEERSFIKYYFIVDLVSFFLCLISRAPTTFGKLGFYGLELKLNVGYIIVFGPVLLMILVLWRLWISVDLSRDRYRIGENNAQSTKLESIVIYIIYILPGLACFFLLVQFVFKTTALPSTNCDRFNHLRLFWDFSLLNFRGWTKIYGWRFAYCFGVSAEENKLMPYVFPPIQTWAYVLIGAITTWWGNSIWQNMNR